VIGYWAGTTRAQIRLEEDGAIVEAEGPEEASVGSRVWVDTGRFGRAPRWTPAAEPEASEPGGESKQAKPAAGTDAEGNQRGA